MLYVIHNEAGEITQANKVYADPAGYDDRLRQLGHRFVRVEQSSLPHPEHWHIRGGDLRERPEMFVVVSKTVIRAGGQDSAILYGCPIGATFAVMTGGHVIDSGTIEGDPDLEVPSLVPCRMTVVLDRWPFKTCKIDIEALP
jgi:hypothetical protein